MFFLIDKNKMFTKNIFIIVAIVACCLSAGVVAQYGMPPPLPTSPPSSYGAPIAPGWPAPPSPDSWAAPAPALPAPAPLSPWDG